MLISHGLQAAAPALPSLHRQNRKPESVEEKKVDEGCGGGASGAEYCATACHKTKLKTQGAFTRCNDDTKSRRPIDNGASGLDQAEYDRAGTIALFSSLTLPAVCGAMSC